MLGTHVGASSAQPSTDCLHRIRARPDAAGSRWLLAGDGGVDAVVTRKAGKVGGRADRAVRVDHGDYRTAVEHLEERRKPGAVEVPQPAQVDDQRPAAGDAVDRGDELRGVRDVDLASDRDGVAGGVVGRW